jgi:uncharacterized protein (TIGR02266 family)
MSSSSLEDLNNERNKIAQRVDQSKAEADDVRNQLQTHQNTLSQLESTVNTLNTALADIQIQKVDIEKQEIQAQVALNDTQKALQTAHQQAAQLAQSLGEAFQKHKRFEEALAVLDQNLNTHSAGRGGLPKPPGFSGGGLPKPPSFPGGGFPKLNSSSSPFGDEPRLTEVNPAISNDVVQNDPVNAIHPPQEPLTAKHNPTPIPISTGEDQSTNSAQFTESIQSNSAPISSRKRMPRFNFQTQAQFEVKVDGQSTHNFYTGFTQNISEGGLFIATGEIINVGTEIDLNLNLPTFSSPALLKGVVRWVRHDSQFEGELTNGVGVQFINISPTIQEQINQFLEHRDSMFYDD